VGGGAANPAGPHATCDAESVSGDTSTDGRAPAVIGWIGTPGTKIGSAAIGSTYEDCSGPEAARSAFDVYRSAAGLSTRWKTASAMAGSISGGLPATKVGNGANASSGNG